MQSKLAFFALFASLAVVHSPLLADDKDPQASTKPDTIAVFSFAAPVTDRPTADDPLFGSLGAESLGSLTKRLDQASQDGSVAAVTLVFDRSEIGFAQIEEIRQAIARVRQAGKPVYAHADSVKTGSYALLCGASRLSIAPTGDVWITGLYGEQLFVRGLLDLLHVEPDFLTCGAYKSAAEMFMRRAPSPEAQEMYTWLFDSLFDSLVDMIAQGRGVERQQVLGWINQGMFSAEQAHKAGLIDAVETREELTAFLKAQHGVTVKLDKSFAKKSGTQIDLNNPFAALQLWAEILSGPQQRRSTKDAIAVVHVDGPIMLGKPETSLFGPAEGAYSETIRKALDEVADEPRIKGVVLRVNSPGGSATASEIILQAVMRVQSRKPVVVSMGDVAASGGYYVSCRGERIFADRTTITGSIGVVAGKLATTKMWDRVGINFQPIQRGERASILSSSRTFTDDEREAMQSWMDEIYAVFQRHVTEGRQDKLTKPIDDLAGGRVYTGAQALELGLIDDIGSLHDAVTYLAEKTSLSDYEIRTFPPARNFLEILVEDLSPKKKDDPRIAASLWEAALPLLKGVDPDRVRLVQQALVHLEQLHHERVILVMPVMQFFPGR